MEGLLGNFLRQVGRGKVEGKKFETERGKLIKLARNNVIRVAYENNLMRDWAGGWEARAEPKLGRASKSQQFLNISKYFF